MKHLKSKIEEGVVSLKNISTEKLIGMAQEVETHEDLDVIGHEVFYR